MAITFKTWIAELTQRNGALDSGNVATASRQFLVRRYGEKDDNGNVTNIDFDSFQALEAQGETGSPFPGKLPELNDTHPDTTFGSFVVNRSAELSDDALYYVVTIDYGLDIQTFQPNDDLGPNRLVEFNYSSSFRQVDESVHQFRLAEEVATNPDGTPSTSSNFSWQVEQISIKTTQMVISVEVVIDVAPPNNLAAVLELNSQILAEHNKLHKLIIGSSGTEWFLFQAGGGSVSSRPDASGNVRFRQTYTWIQDRGIPADTGLMGGSFTQNTNNNIIHSTSPDGQKAYALPAVQNQVPDTPTGRYIKPPFGFASVVTLNDGNDPPLPICETVISHEKNANGATTLPGIAP